MLPSTDKETRCFLQLADGSFSRNLKKKHIDSLNTVISVLVTLRSTCHPKLFFSPEGKASNTTDYLEKVAMSHVFLPARTGLQFSLKCHYSMNCNLCTKTEMFGTGW